MAGRGPAPNLTRRRRGAPGRGEWQATPGHGWQHGPIPTAPDGLLPDSIAAWQSWMKSWWASNWTPEDLPGLTLTIRLYNQVASYLADPFVEKANRKGETIYVLKPNPAPEVRQLMDNYGITPKGRQDRRWLPPKTETAAPATPEKVYGHLRAVNE